MNRMYPPVSEADRAHIIQDSTDIWSQLRNRRIFITGGTGFFGKWLLEAFAAANDFLGTGIGATILTRDPARFVREVPHLALRQEFQLLAGTSDTFVEPDGRFDFLVDFATPSAADVSAGGLAIFEHCLRGTANLIEFARKSGVPRILFASSGAAYGPQPLQVQRIDEDFLPDESLLTPYGKLKRNLETQWLDSGIGCVIARGFAFVGPYLPLTEKFAAGSFLRDALAGGPIRIHGDGSQVRSYLYGSDLARWLAALLANGRSGQTYNVGSEEAVTIFELAELIGRQTGSVVARTAPVDQAKGERYVPDTRRARDELGLTQQVSLPTAIERSLAWARLL